MRTPMGRAYGGGGTAAIVAFLLGIVVMRQAEIQRLRARGALIGRFVTILLLIALGLMAVARYL